METSRTRDAGVIGAGWLLGWLPQAMGQGLLPRLVWLHLQSLTGLRERVKMEICGTVLGLSCPQKDVNCGRSCPDGPHSLWGWDFARGNAACSSPPSSTVAPGGCLGEGLTPAPQLGGRSLTPLGSAPVPEAASVQLLTQVLMLVSLDSLTLRCLWPAVGLSVPTPTSPRGRLPRPDDPSWACASPCPGLPRVGGGRTDAQRPFVRPGWLPDPSLPPGLGWGAGTEALLRVIEGGGEGPSECCQAGRPSQLSELWAGEGRTPMRQVWMGSRLPCKAVVLRCGPLGTASVWGF